MDSPPLHEDYVPTFYIGQHESDRVEPVTDEIVRRAHDCNYDMVTASLTNSHFRDRVFDLFDSLYEDAALTVSPLTKLDTDLGSGDLTSQLLAVASPWIDLSSPDPLVYNISRQVLHLEVAYAAFCGVANIIVPGPNTYGGTLHVDGVAQYAYAIQEILEIGIYHHVLIRLPMSDDSNRPSFHSKRTLASYVRPIFAGKANDEDDLRRDAFGMWDAWNVIRSICKYNNRIFVALDVARPLPLQSIQSRWHSEPLRLLILHQLTFQVNDYGDPVLPRTHQAFLTKFMRIRNPPWLLLSDVGPIPGADHRNTSDSSNPASITSPDAFPSLSEAVKEPQKSSKSSQVQDTTLHLRCIRRYQRKQPPRTPLERFGQGYQDYLQAPLQPLTDNLESITYEVFEKDPVKYDWYEEAIKRALTDWRKDDRAASGPNNTIVVAVVGAGRGPLVTRALRASEAAKVDIELWAVEKNPNACVLLERHNEHDWHHRVNLVRSDMRSWKGPFREAVPSEDSPHGFSPGPPTTQLPGFHTHIDILVSELLGSFADNELSPECLDGILPLLNPSHGISIPQSYTAFLTPIAAPRLHTDIASRTVNDPTAPHTPYVVMLHAIDYLSTSSTQPPSTSTSTSAPTPPPTPPPNILPVWSFIHGPAASPAPSTNSHNTRQARLTFRTRDRGVCHGLAGYFESVLYPGVELSTNPLTMEAKSPGMMSWFPIFFPLKTPLYTPDHAELTATMRRCTDERKVWYEWVVESWGWNLMIGGEKRRVRLGVSEVGSSKAGGCMM